MFFTALILGFTGSVHCIGMCSPLAAAVTNLSRQAWLNRLLYNTGRIMTYAALGFAAASTDALIPVSRYQNVISIAIGIMLLAMGFSGISSIRLPIITPMMVKFISLLKKFFAYFLQKKHKGAVVVLGMINGLLPCGLTFMALLYCLTLQGPWQGFSYMLLFGVGTLPAMLGLTVLLNPLIRRFQWNLRHVMTILLITSGCLLIARGMVSHGSHEVLQTQVQTHVVDCR